MKFTHLHLHSDYSSLDSLCQLNKLVKRIKELGHDSCAITDHGTLSGCFKFNEICKKEGIKPILGMETYYCEDIAEKVFPSHLTILAQNKTGWKNLLKLSYFGATLGFYYRPRISWDKLLECSEGLIVLSGCLSSPFSKLILSGEDCSEEIRKFQFVFGARFFLEISKHGIDREKTVNDQLLLMGKKFDIRCVATNDVHYINKSDFSAHEIIMCLAGKTEINNPERMKLPCNEFYYKSTDEMLALHDIEHINNSNLISNMIESDLIEKQTSVLPEYPKNEIERRINSFARGRKLSEDETNRVKSEMEIINSAKLQSYFLMVADYVNYANKNEMYVGTGRGSVAGSLVAHFLGIHSVDPLKYGLLFSRFYNKGRSGSLPDIDIDFSLRDIVSMRHHMEDEYGKDHVAVIGTLNTMSAKSAIKAVARTLEVSFAESNLFTKSLEDESIEDCLLNPKLRAIYDKDKRWRDIIALALILEGNIYSESIHAAGIVVSQVPLIDIVPCRIDKKSGMLVTCWDMQDLENLGLLKFDFLSLATLDIIQETLSEVGIKFYHDLPLNDKKAYQELCKGNTVGVFQLGSDGITKLTRQIKPKSIEDLGVIVALYRPGPLGSGLDQQYVARKFSKQKIKYKHPNLEPALKETYGIFVYQESIVRALVDLAGFSEHEADSVRKIMGKKLGDEAMAKVGKDFIDRCVKKEIDIKIAKDIWSEMQYFSGYAFNKCISGSTIIYRGNSGRGNDKPTISHLFKIKNNRKYSIKCNQKDLYKKLNHQGYGEILALDSDNRIRPRKIKNIMFSGLKKTYEMELSNGVKIRATKDHKLLSNNGFIMIGDIIIGETKLIFDGGYEKTKIFAGFSDKNNTWKNRSYINPQEGFDFGENNPAYTNGSFTEFKKSKKILSAIKYCQKCGITVKKSEYHHIDGDRGNSIITNIEKLCNSCHKKADYVLGKRKKRWSKGHKIDFVDVVSIKYFGEEETYDIEMDTDEHNFVANGLVNSNSHSISYAHLTYYTSYLKNKFPAQFLCACLNSALGEREKISKFLREASRLGVEVKPVNISISKDLFTSDGISIYCGFSVIKQVGFGTEDKISRTSLLDFFTKSTIGSRAITNILLCGGFDHVNPNRNSLVKYYEEIKAVKVKDDRFTLFSPYDHIKAPDIPDMTIKEKIKIEFELIGHILSVDMFKLPWFMSNIVDYSYIEHCSRTGGPVKLGGIITDFNKFVTKKSQRVMGVFNLYAKDYTVKVVCFPDQYQQYSDRLFDGNLVSVVGKCKEEEESLTIFVEYVNNIL